MTEPNQPTTRDTLYSEVEFPPLPPPPYIYEQDRTTDSRPRSSAIRVLVMIGVYIAGFVSGAVLIAGIWLLSSGANTWTDKNTPDAILSGRRAHASESKPSSHIASTALSQADLDFGEQQVERMVKDRPEMVRYARKEDPVWQHCLRAFAGEAAGAHAYWDSSMPLGDEYPADHQGPNKYEQGSIRIRKVFASGYLKGSPLPCEALWACAVYELESMKSSKGYNDLYERALKGKLSREDWIRENTILEYEACRRTAKLYPVLWKSVAEKRGFAASGEYWHLEVPDTYEAWISRYVDPNSYPWDAWGKYYDEEMAPFLKSQGLR